MPLVGAHVMCVRTNAHFVKNVIDDASKLRNGLLLYDTHWSIYLYTRLQAVADSITWDHSELRAVLEEHRSSSLIRTDSNTI